MSGAIVGIAGFSLFFNFFILKYKFENGRVADGFLDAIVFGAIMYLTAGSQMGMIIGIVGSTLFSLYLLWKPFKLDGLEMA